jgi:hypothetical protein
MPEASIRRGSLVQCVDCDLYAECCTGAHFTCVISLEGTCAYCTSYRVTNALGATAVQRFVQEAEQARQQRGATDRAAATVRGVVECPHCEAVGWSYGDGLITCACGRRTKHGKVINGCPVADRVLSRMGVRASQVEKLDREGPPEKAG